MCIRDRPTLLREGKVYIAETPLFEITPNKGEIEFAYNEFEKNEIVKRLEAAGKKYTLQRSKGLGENSADMMAKTTMNPASRRLIPVSYTHLVFSSLAGLKPDSDETSAETSQETKGTQSSYSYADRTTNVKKAYSADELEDRTIAVPRVSLRPVSYTHLGLLHLTAVFIFEISALSPI